MPDSVEFAPAKINLALHVTGQRPDGYHLIESIVAFVQTGDRLTARDASSDTFTLDGPFADALSRESDNLVLRARDTLRAKTVTTTPVSIHLEKNLPVAAGIGGGSADAAACLRALQRLWSLPDSPADLSGIAIGLGADVAMCLRPHPLFATGIGDVIETVSAMPTMPMVLINPKVPVLTPEVFQSLDNKNNPGITPPTADTAEQWIAALQGLRNDLQAPAEEMLPVIADCSSALTDNGALLARMSGSGATCFGLYADVQRAAAAAEAIRAVHAAWYVTATATLPD